MEKLVFLLLRSVSINDYATFVVGTLWTQMFQLISDIRFNEYAKNR